MSNPLESLGKPIGGGVGSGIPVGHTVPTDGFDQGEHGAGTGVSGGHVPSATNQARGYGADTSSFNSGLGGEHASGGLPGHSHSSSTPIADKFMGSGSHGADTGHSHSHTPTGGAVSGAYSGGGTRDALTGESDAHRTGSGVGYLAENLKGAAAGTTGHSSSHHHSSTTDSSRYNQSQTVGDNTYGGTIDRHATGGEHHAHSARDAALTGTAGAAAATALGSGVTGTHSGPHGSHGIQSGTGVGIGPTGGSGGHYSTEGQHGTGSGHHSGAGLAAGAAGVGAGAGAAGLASRSTGDHQNIGTGSSAGISAAQQASSRGTHGDSGLSGAGAAGIGAAGAAGAAGASSRKSGEVERGQPLSDPKSLDHGTRHSLILDPSTGKYVHRHELDESKRR